MGYQYFTFYFIKNDTKDLKFGMHTHTLLTLGAGSYMATPLPLRGWVPHDHTSSSECVKLKNGSWVKCMAMGWVALGTPLFCQTTIPNQKALFGVYTSYTEDGLLPKSLVHLAMPLPVGISDQNDKNNMINL